MSPWLGLESWSLWPIDGPGDPRSEVWLGRVEASGAETLQSNAKESMNVNVMLLYI